jgi:mono/diheme cytochrome c family protein
MTQMNRIALIGLSVVGALALQALGLMLFVGSGVYNIGADDHHTKLVLAIIEQLREQSIRSRARSISVPNLAEQKFAAGAARYADLCVGCHLAPGVMRSTLRSGLYPHPPNLAEEGLHDAQETFWTIKHGIKMSAMPAWGRNLDDEAIWQLVAFIQQLPEMTPETYAVLTKTDSGQRFALESAGAARN